MANIRKRVGKKGTTYQVRYPSKSSNSGYAYKPFDTRKEAQAFIESGEARQKGASAGTQDIDVPKAIDLWLDICENIGRDGRETVENQTLYEYSRRASVMKEYRWPKSLQELEPSDCVEFRNWLIKNKTRDLARRTFSSFHSVLIEMKLQGYRKDDPAAGLSVRRDGRYEDDGSEVEIPSDQEMRDILGAADIMGKKNEFMEECWARYRPKIYLATFSGMRSSEYRGAPWPNIEDRLIRVTQRADKTGIIGPVKSKAAKRTLHIPLFVTDMVFEWKERCHASPHQLIFPTKTGKPILLNNFILQAWRPLLREAGLTYTKQDTEGREVERAKYTPHALRHYYASKLIEKTKGKDLKFIQHAMGHSRIETTLNIYGHLIKGKSESHRKTVEAIASDIVRPPCANSVPNKDQGIEVEQFL